MVVIVCCMLTMNSSRVVMVRGYEEALKRLNSLTEHSGGVNTVWIYKLDQEQLVVEETSCINVVVIR